MKPSHGGKTQAWSEWFDDYVSWFSKGVKPALVTRDRLVGLRAEVDMALARDRRRRPVSAC